MSQAPCNCCQAARLYPPHNFFNPACIYCGARIIQRLGTLQIPQSQRTSRRRTELAIWLAHGHNEAQIRALVCGPLALEPLPEPPQQDNKTPRPRR